MLILFITFFLPLIDNIIHYFVALISKGLTWWGLNLIEKKYRQNSGKQIRIAKDLQFDSLVKIKSENVAPLWTRLFVNIAQDCESFKAKKGYTRLYKAILMYKRQTRAGIHSYTTYVIYHHIHKINHLITTLQDYSRLKITSHYRNALDVSRINNPTLLLINNAPLLPINYPALL